MSILNRDKLKNTSDMFIKAVKRVAEDEWEKLEEEGREYRAKSKRMEENARKQHSVKLQAAKANCSYCGRLKGDCGCGAS